MTCIVRREGGRRGECVAGSRTAACARIVQRAAIAPDIEEAVHDRNGYRLAKGNIQVRCHRNVGRAVSRDGAQDGGRGINNGVKGLSGVACAEGAGCLCLPCKIRIHRTGAGKLQRTIRRSGASFADANVRTGHATCCTIYRGEHPFVAQKLNDRTAGINQCHAVWGAILDAIGSVADDVQIVGTASSSDRAERIGIVRCPIVAIVEDDGPARQICA